MVLSVEYLQLVEFLEALHHGDAVAAYVTAVHTAHVLYIHASRVEQVATANSTLGDNRVLRMVNIFVNILTYLASQEYLGP